MDSIFESIVSVNNLFAAWREFRCGKRKKPDVQEFERYLEDNIFQLHDELAGGEYQHGSYHRFYVFDPKHRIIHKASVRDRLIHHAVYRVLYPVFDRSFIFDSYSCRLGKGTHAAVNRLEKFARQCSQNYTRPCRALKLDIKKFFDSVDHGILLSLLKQKIACPKTNELLKRIIQSYSTPKTVGGGSLFEAGLPIGNLTSQLFANIYLDAFDHFIKEELRVKYYLRYTDDFVILTDNPNDRLQFLAIAKNRLWNSHRLTLHPNKIVWCRLSQGIDYLGYVILSHHRVLRTKTRRRMLQRVSSVNLPSYLGLLEQCCGYRLKQMIRRRQT